MNFISTFDELNKLYESQCTKKRTVKKPKDTELVEGDDYWRDRPYHDQSQKDKGVIRGYQPPAGYKGSKNSWEDKCRDSQEMNKNLRRNPWESVEEPVSGEELVEAAEDEEIEIVDDDDEEEMPEDAETAVEAEVAEEPVVEEEPRQVIIECSKCGALVIKPEADIVVDEESDLVNVKDKCDFCEEKEGFKIVGIVMPYETEEVDIVTEGLGDWYRKKFDRPASVTTQQMWESEMEDLQLALEGELDDATRAKYEARLKELEQKFLQQRDWESRHAKVEEACDDEELEELLDIKPSLSLSLDGGQGNDVSVLGR